MTHQPRRLTTLELHINEDLECSFLAGATNYIGIEKLHWSARPGQQENIGQDAQYIRLASRET